MNDIYLTYPNRTEYVTREVREYKAPTDDSARLLEELTQAAEDRINKMVRVKDMNIDCVVHIMRSHVDLSTKFKTIFSLNGKRYTVDYISPDMEARETAIDKLVAEIADKITREILIEAFKKCNWL